MTLTVPTAAPTPPEPDDWADLPPIRDMQHAEWQLRHLARLDAQAAEVDRLAAAEADRIKEWHQTERARIDARRDALRVQLQGWHQAQLADDDRRKTIPLPSGVLRSRRNGPKVKVTDSAQFVEWARVLHDDLLVISYRPDAAAVAKRLAGAPVLEDGSVVDTATGEVIPGVTVLPESVSFTVTTGADQ